MGGPPAAAGAGVHRGAGDARARAQDGVRVPQPPGRAPDQEQTGDGAGARDHRGDDRRGDRCGGGGGVCAGPGGPDAQRQGGVRDVPAAERHDRLCADEAEVPERAREAREDRGGRGGDRRGGGHQLAAADQRCAERPARAQDGAGLPRHPLHHGGPPARPRPCAGCASPWSTRRARRRSHRRTWTCCCRLPTRRRPRWSW